jgi:DNA (cytosine-5)-methyltransferase 1
MAEGDDSTDWTSWKDDRSPLVCQPIRWVRDLQPEWVALEEVPQVASLWEHFTRILDGWGYSTWTGDLCAADYGVPQTRIRRILIASRSRKVGPPPPTHSEVAHGEDLLGGYTLPWVTMAEALGWGFDEPSATISGGGSASGGAEPFANANYRRRLTKIVTKQRSGGSGSDEYYSRSSYRPAPTITGGSHQWVFERPATTVVGQFRPDIIAAPGFRKDVSRQNAAGSVRVTVQDVATLQGFRPDYPWQGPRTKQHEQVGNAVPPPLAAHVLAAAIGMTVPKERTT